MDKTKLTKLAYRILNIPFGSDKVAIRKAYRILAMKYHPDKDIKNKENEIIFKNIQNAYEFLIAQKDLSKIKLQNPNDENDFPDDDKFILNNDWGYFLWWKEKFFE